jgi:RNA polymerase sigma-70 factor (ECF subfamily)
VDRRCQENRDAPTVVKAEQNNERASMPVNSRAMVGRLREAAENFFVPTCNPMPRPDEHLRELLLRGLGGDVAAYHAFLRELCAHLRAFLRRRLTGMPDDVEDIVQETLLAVHNQRHTYDAAQPLTAWAGAIAKYKMTDFLRRHGRRERLTDSLDEAAELMQAKDDRAGDARRDIAKLLDALPERQRLPIVYVKLEGRSVLEAARLTGMSQSAVKVGVHRGLRALAAKLRQRT